ncbi:MAG: hypothetical protein KDK66_03015 [Deltaproteobacteria bacterium]|nr:hypothetical protein [Deltaproteobacteria bacterium]
MAHSKALSKAICLSKICLLFILIGFNFFCLAKAKALDGSGSASVNPDGALVDTSASSFSFTYTAQEDLEDAQVRVTFPDPWADPSVSNISMTSGLLADIFDDLDSPTLGDPGWIDDDALGGLLTSVSLNTSNPIEGTGNVRLSISVGLGLGNPSLYYNAPSAMDWSNYTHIAFWIKQSSTLGLSTGDITLQIAEAADLSSAVSYTLDANTMDIPLLEDNDWTYVVVDLTSQAETTRDGVLSFGLVLGNVSLSALATLDVDHIVLGPGSPIFDNNQMTLNILSLATGEDLAFDYGEVTTPSTVGSYEFEFESRPNVAGTLVSLGSSPSIELLNLAEESEGGQPRREREIDGDGETEFAVDILEDGCFSFYLDLDQSSEACFSIQANQDNCVDHFIDIDGDGCEVCPDVFWDATNDFVSTVTLTNLDSNGDGTEEEVCAYDSDGDGEEDSFLLIGSTVIDGQGEEPTIGGQGGGGSNPFVNGGGGCTLVYGESQKSFPLASYLILITVFLMLKPRRF